ncbi:hypothetical protein TNCV_2164971 [Trichonephila clavipes]|nr:hypothetical protein TNCV_2164971 [Trichonephila clavipes]
MSTFKITSTSFIPLETNCTYIYFHIVCFHSKAHLLPSTSTISESQPTIPTFNTNDPLYLADQAIVKKSRKRLLPKYNKTGTSFLQISKSNIPTKFAAIAVKKFATPKLPLIPRRKKRPPKTICKDDTI